MYCVLYATFSEVEYFCLRKDGHLTLWRSLCLFTESLNPGSVNFISQSSLTSFQLEWFMTNVSKQRSTLYKQKRFFYIFTQFF